WKGAWFSSEKSLESDEITTTAQEEVIARGTKKYQYMICSDGTYRYFTDAEFKNENTGFTSKSEDHCSKNNNGFKLRLSETKPVQKSYPAGGHRTGAICRDGSR